MNALDILIELIKKQSITPNDGGCMEYIESILRPLGFRFHYFDNKETRNFYAEVGSGDFNFCFAGHTDVVPVGNEKSWMFPPFSATVSDGNIYGRGTSDMKGAIAAFIAALYKLKGMPKNKRVSLLLTSDEEGPAIDGIQYALPKLEEKGLIPTLCLVGEPTNPSSKMGHLIKIGRRGSFNAKVTIKGVMGHVAYQENAKNPHEPLSQLMQKLIHHEFDKGTEKFAPTNLEITNVNSFNNATNIIPQVSELSFNVRFNTLHNKESLINNLISFIKDVSMELPGFNWDYDISCDSVAEYCDDPFLINVIEKAVQETLNINPKCTTDGATSDARFIQKYCPVVEFGLFTDQAHQIDEHIDIKSLDNLTKLYTNLCEKLVFV